MSTETAREMWAAQERERLRLDVARKGRNYAKVVSGLAPRPVNQAGVDALNEAYAAYLDACDTLDAFDHAEAQGR